MTAWMIAVRTAEIAPTIAGAPAVITFAKEITASPRAWMTSGRMLRIPVMNAVSPAAPAAPAAPKATRAMENAATPNAARPTPTPNSAIAAPRAIRIGVTGASAKPAIPNTVNAPARAASPIPIPAHDRPLSKMSCGTSSASAPATTTMANAPGMLELIKASPKAKIPSEPPRTASPRPMASHPRDDIINSTGESARSDAAAIPRAMDPETLPLIKLRPKARIPRDPPRTASPRPISSQVIPAIRLTAW